jgi:hypothetical protein
MVLEHALAVARDALLAEHPTLVDDFRRPREQGPVVFLAHAICHQQAALRETLWRYRRAVRDVATPAPLPDSDDVLF